MTEPTLAAKVALALRMKLGVKRVPCPACGGWLYLKRGTFGYFYGCQRFPTCKQTQPCDQQTGEPVGEAVDEATRAARHALHLEFDQLWQSAGGLVGVFPERDRAYTWLSNQLGIRKKQCHIQQFDLPTCERALEAVRRLAVQAAAVGLEEAEATPSWGGTAEDRERRDVSPSRRRKPRDEFLPVPASLIETAARTRRIVCLQCDGTGHLEACPSRNNLNGCHGCCPRGCPVPATKGKERG
jgi:ssDNA-binding Zn-finger/Zn-ribbon topoisomerase 1